LFHKAVNLYKTVNLCKTINLYRICDLYKTLNIYKVPNIREILLPLDGRNGTHRVSKVYKDKASRPILDAEEVTILLNISVKA